MQDSEDNNRSISNGVIAIDCEFQELILDKEKKKPSNKERYCEIVDYLLAALFFGPLAILYWASTWNFFYYYILGIDGDNYTPHEFVLSAGTTTLIGLFIHLLAYLFQDKLQKLYYLTDDELYIENERSRTSKGYYFKAFYAYATSVAYVAQWRGLWDLYSHFLDQTENAIYSFIISACGIFLYWFILRRSFYSYATTTPYYLSPDNFSNSYFTKDHIIEYNRSRLLEIIFNFIYYEIVEASIYVIIYKGIWDLYDKIYEESEYSQLIVLFVNYFIYLIINFLQKKIMKKYLDFHYERMGCIKLMKMGFILLNTVSVLAFGSLLGIWSVIWRYYDNQVIGHEYQIYILIITHFSTAIILVVLRTSNSLYGFGGNSNDCETMENNPDESDQLFKIRYINHFLQSKS